jgi:hypothetical protein
MKDAYLFIESKKSYSRRSLTAFTHSILLSFGLFIIINSCYFIIFSQEDFWIVPMIILFFCLIFLYITVFRYKIPIQKVVVYMDRFSPSLIPLYKWIALSPVFVEYSSIIKVKKISDWDTYAIVIYLKNNKKAIIVKDVDEPVKKELMELIEKRIEKKS